MGKRLDCAVKLQAKGRYLYEAEGLHLRGIADKLKISLVSVAKWSKTGLPDPDNGPWRKSSKSAIIVQATEDTMLQAAAKLGLTKGYILEKVAVMLAAKTKTGTPAFDVIDKGLVHAERIIPGIKAEEKLSVDFPAKMLAFFQGTAE